MTVAREIVVATVLVLNSTELSTRACLSLIRGKQVSDASGFSAYGNSDAYINEKCKQKRGYNRDTHLFFYFQFNVDSFFQAIRDSIVLAVGNFGEDP